MGLATAVTHQWFAGTGTGTQLVPERNHDDSDWVSSTVLSHVQALLPGA
ncbi:hypothetical protein AVDCRST_MAG94-6757, partial [uncultured Leptolyngbya sp.]